MTKKTVTSFLLLFTVAFLLIPAVASAQEVKKVKRPTNPTPAVLGTTITREEAEAEKIQEPVSCIFEEPSKKEYKATFVATRKKGAVSQGEAYETQVYIKNDGNMPWFSSDSGCPYLITFLGTDNLRDRNSIFFTNDLMWDSGWTGANRIKMNTKRVEPGQMALFTYWSKAPLADGYYREYFTPIIEGITWMDGGKFSTEIKVGNPVIDFDQKKYWPFIEQSTDLTTVDLSGGKTVDVSLSTQKMQLKIGNHVIREFPVSSGKRSTPTPTGTTKILNKQEVRIAGSYPHYIMPKWLGFRAGGYGIHALPSLANDNGVFWREALNHIGTPRSHGCIRLLPQDAEFAFSFAEVGTTVVVHW